MADDQVTPPAGFSLIQPEQPQQPSGISVPAGFSLVQPQSAPPRAVGQDVAQGVGRGAIQGSGNILGMPADIWHMLDRGYQWAMTKGAEKMGLLTPEQGAALRQPITTATGENLETSPISSERVNNHLLNVAKSLGADTSAPQTGVGQAAENVTSFLPGAAAFGAKSAAEIPAALAKYGLLPGATSEAAGQATQGTAAEPYARVAGAILPGSAAMAQRGVSRLVGGNPIATAFEGLSPQQMQQAEDLLTRSRQMGAPLTLAEAVQQASGSATRASDVQRVVEQSPKGAAIMRPFFAQRPAQVEAAGRQALGEIAPPTTNPYGVAPRVQEAAEQEVKAADRARSAATRPLYRAAAQDQVPADRVEGFLQGIEGLIADDKTGLLSPDLTKLRNSLIESPGSPGRPAQRIATGVYDPSGNPVYRTIPGQPATPRVPITDIENLDVARKFFRDRIAQPAFAQDAVPKQVGARMNGLLSDLDDMMEDASPNFQMGKQLHQDITRNQFEPLMQSPTGQLVGAEAFPKQAEILFNSNPLPGSEIAINKAVRQIAARDPEAAQNLARMYIEKVFNEATQANASGPNQFGGAKFAAVLGGNPQQLKNLQAVITALPNGQVKWNAFKKTFDIFQAMGTRQPPGSQTAFNEMLRKEMEGTGAIPETIAAAASPNRWLGLASEVYRKYAFGQNTKRLAQLMVNGNVSDLQRMIRPNANSMQAQAALVALLAREGASTSQQSP